MADSDDRIYNQIEGAADYYPPATYGIPVTSPLSLLTFWGDYEIQTDSLAEEFIPLSAVAQRARNPKLFAVGILPPSVNISGRLLDRSASIANAQGFETAPDRGEEVPPEDTTQGLKGSALPLEFWVSFVEMCNRLGVNPVDLAAVLQQESGMDPARVAYRGNPPHPVAKGLNQIILKTGVSLGMTPEYWETFETVSAQEQLVWVETYFSRAGVRGKNKGSIYVKNFGGHFGNPKINGMQPLYISRSAYEALSPEDKAKVPTPEKQFVQYTQNSGLDREKRGFIAAEDLARNVQNAPSSAIRRRIEEAQSIVGDGKGVKPSVIVPDASVKYGKGASGSVKAAQKELSKTVGTPLNSSELGKRFQIAQKAQIIATMAALEQMRNVPPLRLLVNPQRMSVKGEKIVSDGEWSRNGPIIEHWGNDQDKISASGKVAAFYAIDARNADGPGLTRNSRNFSQSWQNFQSLYLLYKNNGGMYLSDPTTGGASKNLNLVGSVYIYYDSILYIGSFDSFSISETETAPFTVEYSFEFSVRAAFLLDRTDDQEAYGNRNLFRARPLLSSDTGRGLNDNPVSPPPAQIVQPNPDPQVQPGLTPQQIEQNKAANQRAQSLFESGVISYEELQFRLSQHPVD